MVLKFSNQKGLKASNSRELEFKVPCQKSLRLQKGGDKGMNCNFAVPAILQCLITLPVGIKLQI